MMRIRTDLFCFIVALLLLLALNMQVMADHELRAMTREEFDLWPELPEYTIFNFFPAKGTNCTWYAHGRMMQLGYCKYALDSMRFNARSWANNADRGAEVQYDPSTHAIAFWDGTTSFGGSLGHVAVVEEVRADGSILVSDSSSSGEPYHTYVITPGDRKWPSGFIVVPPGREKSIRFAPGDRVVTTGDGLNFRLKGINQSSVTLPGGTSADIQEHTSNGFYASQPGSTTSYHNWWYAAVLLDDEYKFGWLAETYLEPAGSGKIIPEPEPDQQPVPEPEEKPEPETNPDPKPDPDLKPDPAGEPEIIPGQYPALKTGDLNNDGIVDVRDVNLALRHILELTTLDDRAISAADINEDGQVDIIDVVAITRYTLGLIDSLKNQNAPDQ